MDQTNEKYIEPSDTVQFINEILDKVSNNLDSSTSFSKIPRQPAFSSNSSLKTMSDSCAMKTFFISKVPDKVSDDDSEGETKVDCKDYRVQDPFSDIDDDSDDTSSTFSLGSSSDFSDSFNVIKPKISIPKAIHIKTKGELDLDDLPKIEDLHITIMETEAEKIGHISSIVGKLVVVRGFKTDEKHKPLDCDSVLFLNPQKPLGRIFDVIGPVIEPYYTVRFNSEQDIVDKDITSGADVFYAPARNDITTFVFVDKLIDEKGSDASWRDNNEPPEEYLDYSDDEQERVAKQKRRAKNRPLECSDIQELPAKITPSEKQWEPSDVKASSLLRSESPHFSNVRHLEKQWKGHNPRQPHHSTFPKHRGSNDSKVIAKHSPQNVFRNTSPRYELERKRHMTQPQNNYWSPGGCQHSDTSKSTMTSFNRSPNFPEQHVKFSSPFSPSAVHFTSPSPGAQSPVPFLPHPQSPGLLPPPRVNIPPFISTPPPSLLGANQTIFLTNQRPQLHRFGQVGIVGTSQMMPHLSPLSSPWSSPASNFQVNHTLSSPVLHSANLMAAPLNCPGNSPHLMANLQVNTQLPPPIPNTVEMQFNAGCQNILSSQQFLNNQVSFQASAAQQVPFAANFTPNIVSFPRISNMFGPQQNPQGLGGNQQNMFLQNVQFHGHN